VGFLYLAL